MPVALLHADCVSLVCSVMLFWLAAVGFTASGPAAERLPLVWLGWFGFLAGLAGCLDPVPLILPFGTDLGSFRFVPSIAASACLVEFWARRRAARGLPRRAAAPYFLLLVLYAACLGLGLGDPLRLTAGLFAVPAAGLAVLTLLRHGIRDGEGRAASILGAVCLIGLGATHVAGLLAVAGPWVTGAEAASLSIPRMALAGGLVFAVWRLGTPVEGRAPLARAVGALWLPALLLPVLAAGCVLASNAGRDEDDRLTSGLVRHAATVAAILDAEPGEAFLNGGEADYLRLKRRLAAMIRGDPGLGFAAVYVLTPVGPRTCAVSAGPDDPRYLAPGDRFPGVADAAGEEALRRGTPVVQKQEDIPLRGGARVHLALAGGGPGLAVLTLDASDPEWLRIMSRARLAPLRMTLLGSVLLLGFFCTLRVRRVHESKVRASERRYHSLFVSMQEGVIYCRILEDGHDRPADFEILDMNPAAEKLTGFPRQEVVGRRVTELFPESRDELMKWIDYFGTVARTGRTRSREMLFTPRRRWFLVRGFSWRTGSFAISMTDVTERRLAEQEHKRLALHDPLTELPNRRLFRDRLDQAVARADRNGTKCAVLYLDLNEFKTVNDTHGHAYGDMVLAEVARRLKSCMRRSDTLARIGGDEFVAVVPEFDGPEEIAAVASKIQTAMSKPFAFGGQAVVLGVSIGVGVYPDHGEDAGTVLVRADAAMYKGKGDRSRQFVFYDE